MWTTNRILPITSKWILGVRILPISFPKLSWNRPVYQWYNAIPYAVRTHIFLVSTKFIANVREWRNEKEILLLLNLTVLTKVDRGVCSPGTLDLIHQPKQELDWLLFFESWRWCSMDSSKILIVSLIWTRVSPLSTYNKLVHPSVWKGNSRPQRQNELLLQDTARFFGPCRSRLCCLTSWWWRVGSRRH